MVEIVIHNGKVFTYGYDGEGNRLWRTYSQYPEIKPPVDEGERTGDKKSKGKANNESDNLNNDSNQKNESNDVSYFESTEPLSTPLSLYDAEADEIVDFDNELVSLLALNKNEDLIESVDSYLLNINVLSNDKDKNNKNSNQNDGIKITMDKVLKTKILKVKMEKLLKRLKLGKKIMQR